MHGEELTTDMRSVVSKSFRTFDDKCLQRSIELIDMVGLIKN